MLHLQEYGLKRYQTNGYALGKFVSRQWTEKHERSELLDVLVTGRTDVYLYL